MTASPPTERVVLSKSPDSLDLVLPLALAAATWTGGQALLPDMGSSLGSRIEAVSAARSAEQAATVLLFLAGVALVVGATALRRSAPFAERPRLAGVGAIALGLGGVWLCTGRAAFNLQMIKATDPDVTPSNAVDVLSASEGWAFAPFPLTLLALLLAPVLLSLSTSAGWLSRGLPVILWVVGMGVFVATEFTVKVGEVAGVAIAGIGLVLAGVALSRERSATRGRHEE
jgi:hypothetical protein